MSMERVTHEPVGREQLRDLLRRWQAGAIDERRVHERAESMWESHPGEQPDLPHDDPRSIAIEVLLQLDSLSAQLITPADVPAFMDFLDTRAGEEESGWERYQTYWDGVDFDGRLKELADNPYYSKSAPPTR